MRRLWMAAFVLSVLSALYLTLRPVTDPQPPPFPHFDKLAHGGMWAVMALLGGAAFRQRTAVLRLMAFLLALGLATECLQIMVPGRAFEWLDWAADSLGCGTVCYFWWRVQHRHTNAGSKSTPVV